MAACLLVVLAGLFLWQRAAERPPNLLFITLDTMRADHLGCYGNTNALTPVLDRLAADGTLFEQVMASCPVTLPSHATMFTGLNPPEHGLRNNARGSLASTIPVLAEILKRRGYRTGAIIAAPILSAKYGLARGFDYYDDRDTGLRDEHEGVPLYGPGDDQDLRRYRPGNEIADAALEWLSRADGAAKPFFCWAHFYDPHQPYHAHTNLFGARFVNAEYDGDAAFMDIQIGRLLEFLDQRGWRQNTIVVAVGDHGQGLDEHNEKTHGFMLYNTTMQCPLIIAPPGRKAAGRRIAALLPLADLFPTVLELLGVPPPPDHPARSFAAALGGAVVASRPCYGETMLPYQGYGWSPLWSYTTPEWKYIRTPEPELYDRRTDPRELRNLAGEQAAKLAELDSQLTAMQAGMRPAAAAAVTLSAADKRQLQSLGYTAGGSAAAGPADYRKLRDIKEMIAIPDMYGMMMTAFRQRDFGERTQALCEELIRLSPETATFHNDLGTIWVNRGDFQRAEECYRAALARDPGFLDVYNNLGIALARQGRFPEAIAEYEAALAIQPQEGKVLANLAITYNDYGYALGRQGDFTGAVERFNQSLALNPNAAETHQNLGVALMGLRDFAAAVAQFEMALSIRPNYPIASHNLAIARRRLAGESGNEQQQN